jgi:uncharacterized protein (DUF3820 family)
MTKKEWNELRIGEKVLWNEQIFTVNRFNFGCSQAEIISENGFKTWVGRTTIEFAEEKPKEVFTDETPMPFGKYKGIKMANVPASYLLWLYDNNKCYGALKDYIKDNIDVLNVELKKKQQIF